MGAANTVKAQIAKAKMPPTPGQTLPTVKIESDSADSAKRKREDDDYDVP